LKRLPIRIRLTLAFTSVMAIVLAATGVFLYFTFGAGLDRSINSGLRTRVADVSALVKEADAGLAVSGKSQLSKRGGSFAQILTSKGIVFDATAAAGKTPLLTPADVRRALHGELMTERPVTSGGASAPELVRLVAAPVAAQDRRLVVVVGTSLETRSEAIANLSRLLAIGGLSALLLSALAGYSVATAALRPVDAMRRRASTITADAPGDRLPVTTAPDELRRLAVTLNEMLGRLEDALATERVFVANSSHELRTPLAILKMELELALRSDRSVDQLRESIRSAAEETDLLVGLSEDLLVLARSDQGGLPMNNERVAIAEVCERARSRFADRASGRGRAIVVTAPDDAFVYADRVRVEQTISNLVDNALRYGDGPITIRAREAAGTVTVTVSDEGSGFPDEFVPRAFERFTRADESRQRGGSGLGLAICATIVEAGGGDIWIDGASPSGASVSFTLPVADRGSVATDVGAVKTIDDAATSEQLGSEQPGSEQLGSERS
jgi:heavy metal sensor kinase